MLLIKLLHDALTVLREVLQPTCQMVLHLVDVGLEGILVAIRFLRVTILIDHGGLHLEVILDLLVQHGVEVGHVAFYGSLVLSFNF